MYRVIYDNNGKVVGVYEFKIEEVSHYFGKQKIDEENGVDILGEEREIQSKDISNYLEVREEKRLEEVPKIFFRKEYNSVDFETIPEYGKNQYLVYENGNLIVKTNIQNYELLVEKYIRERYSVSQEFAILRQKETKPIEYQEYFEYCEQCKARAKAEIGNVL